MTRIRLPLFAASVLIVVGCHPISSMAAASASAAFAAPPLPTVKSRASSASSISRTSSCSSLSISRTSTSTSTTTTTTTTTTTEHVDALPWYSDPELDKDRSHVIPPNRGLDYEHGDDGDATLCPTLRAVLAQPTSRIIPFRGSNVYVRREVGGDEASTIRGGTVEPLLFEECVVRETQEESGVGIDQSSIRFVASQPWPFPRSMMVGLHASAAAASSTSPQDVDGENCLLPKIDVDPAELEDCQWFSKEYVRENGLVQGKGSSALDFDPDEEESIFHIPVPASLARLLIAKWALGDSN